MMVIETTRDNGPWAQGGSATVRGIDPEADPLIGAGGAYGLIHGSPSFPDVVGLEATSL